MKVQKTQKKVGPFKSTKVQSEPSNPPPPNPPNVINPIKLISDNMASLKNENNELRVQFKQLVEMLDKKFESMDQVDQEKLTQVRADSVQPEQQDPRSEGLLSKKVGDMSIGEALSSIGNIAKAWQQQTSMERDSQGVNSLKDFMADIGQSVFSDFVKQKGLKVAEKAAQETTASAYG